MIDKILNSIPSDTLAGTLLSVMSTFYNLNPAYRKELKSVDGWMNFAVAMKTENENVARTIFFMNGFSYVKKGISSRADATMIFRDEDALRKMLTKTPNEVLSMLLTSELRLSGNLSIMNKFNYLMSVLLEKNHKKMMLKKASNDRAEFEKEFNQSDEDGSRKLESRKKNLLSGEKSDCVEFLDNPYLPEYSLEDFPRLKNFLEIHHTVRPELCPERPVLLTQWFRKNGYEQKPDGTPHVPVLRQGAAFKHLMKNRKPIIRKNDLIAGTTTSKEIGVVLYPDTSGTLIWGELRSLSSRELFPYEVSEETRKVLHHDIFPFWEKRNVREWVRENFDNPLCKQLDERFAVYFMWKTVAISHTIADFPKLLALGTNGLSDEIRDILKTTQDEEKSNLLKAMLDCFEGINAYADNLARQAMEDAKNESDPVKRKELEDLSEICSKVPRNPASTLHEALNTIWIVWLSLHMENTNAGLSIGRVDQWLQPYFANDIKKIDSYEGRANYVRRAIELCGCFYMKCTDHLPLIPDIGNFLFGGSSSDQAITLGGVAPDGSSAVNDMTYVFLKVTEILCLRDPNVNARFHPEINSDTYLRRLCEVNLVTTATPSMHNDNAVMNSLAEFNYPEEHLRDWAATGCVEPTLSGRHIGHTNCMMMNMVAALEMALNDGLHPLMNWQIGPRTGPPESFLTMDAFFNAFCEQFRFLIDNACDYNNMLGKAHSIIRPTPLLSSLIEGCMESGKDVTIGGAMYNTSGAACIGLADVTDSLMTIKKLVFDDHKTSFKYLADAVADNFQCDIELLSMIKNRVPKFGSGDEEALEMAQKVAKFTHDCYGDHVNFRGGKYTAGFWSMSNHVAFGTLTGALPSGRLAKKPFTPGLTPDPAASENLIDPLRDVAALKPEYMNNNIAFNVKLVPGANDTHERTVDNMKAYVKTYFDLGGMQMQFNVVTSSILRDAMKNPENYRNLLVRISGYNAYFVTLNRDLQRELIERAEYGV